MKIGIVTLVGYFNYGNRLQNYALQKVLQDITGETVKTLIFVTDDKAKEHIKVFLYKENGKIKINNYRDIVRELRFRYFSLKYIKSKRIKVKQDRIPQDIDDDFDLLIVGSDQVWNPYYWDSIDCQKYLLTFSTSQKKISYAASFGVDCIGKEWGAKFGNELKRFKAISVREASGKRILNRIIESQIEVVLDPTMLITSDDWRKMKSRLYLKREYILIFALGDDFDNTEIVEEYAKNHNYMIINLSDPQSAFYSCGPRTFLALIDEASLVITDSFHATVFSILFHTDFIIVNRKQKSQRDMSSRIKTLLDVFNLDERYGNINDNIEKKCDFTSTDWILDKERARSYEWLKNAIG